MGVHLNHKRAYIKKKNSFFISLTNTLRILVNIYLNILLGDSICQKLTNIAMWQEKYWEEHPGKAVPLMRPKFYGGPWRVMGGNEPPSEWKALEAAFFILNSNSLHVLLLFDYCLFGVNKILLPHILYQSVVFFVIVLLISLVDWLLI